MRPIDRLEKKFAALRKSKKKALIPFIMAGDPDLQTTSKLILELDKSGADLIELGIPFSDPLADGPTIQKSAQRSLNSGTTPKMVLEVLGRISPIISSPIILLTYLNPILQYKVSSSQGAKGFLKEASSKGACAIVIPDLPFEESKELRKLATKQGIALIQLAATTSTHARLRQIAASSQGFIYYVSLTGTTGTRKHLSSEWLNGVRQLRLMTTTPICVGFGISTPEQAAKVCRFADGAIVGSALIKALEPVREHKTQILKKASAFIRRFKKAI